MRAMKTYLTFTSRLYRWLVLIIVPGIAIGMNLVWSIKINGLNLIISCLLFVGIEIFADFYLFGGLSSKDGMGMRYLQTSVKGKQMLRTAIQTDLLVKIFPVAVITIISMIQLPYADSDAIVLPSSGLWSMEFTFLNIGLAAVCAIYFGTWIGRYFNGYGMVLFISYAAILLFLLLLAIPILHIKAFIYTIFLLAGVAILFWINASTIMRKWDASYLDAEE